jgi:hypothetical protein
MLDATFPGAFMIAVTIGVGKYAEMALHAAAAVRRHTGLETIIIGDGQLRSSGLTAPHHLKFRLFDLVDADQLMYFDADLVALNSWDPKSAADPEAIVAVRDRIDSSIQGDAERAGVRFEEYFNSGLFMISRRHHHAWLRAAEQDAQARSRPIFFDQTSLNAARAKLGLELKLLDRRYNWVAFGTGPLCYQVPVFMAHRLKQGRNDVNMAYYRGEYHPPLDNSFQLNEPAMAEMGGRMFTICEEGGIHKQIRLRKDGTIAAAPGPQGECYWFVHEDPGGLKLAIAADTHVVRSFSQMANGTWESVARLRAATTLEQDAAAGLVAQRWFEYVRIGHDQRRMEFLDDGSIGAGSADCEQRWQVMEESGGRVALILLGRGDETTCRLAPSRRNAYRCWTGQWLNHECMAIELRGAD